MPDLPTVHFIHVSRGLAVSNVRLICTSPHPINTSKPSAALSVIREPKIQRPAIVVAFSIREQITPRACLRMPNALSRSSCETFPWCSQEIVRVLRPAKDLFGSFWSRKLHCTVCHRPAPIARVDEVTSDATNASGWPNSRGAERSDGILAASQVDFASEGCMVPPSVV
jgi:hypothetical protein